MVQGRLEISARKNPLEVYRKSARVPPADSARKNPLEVSRKSARVPPYTTDVYMYSFYPQTIRDWNDLPESLIYSSELSDDSVSKFTSLVRARD